MHRGENRIAYRGWRVVAGMFVVTAALFGSTIYGFIILTQPIGAERGWTATKLGSLVSALWLVSPLALVCAPVIARFGAWRLMLVGLLILAISFAAIPLVREFWQFYLLRMVTGVGKTCAIVSVPVIVAQWFSHRFGMAIAIAWCGGAFGGLVLSPLTEAIVTAFGWHAAAMFTSAMLLAVAALAAWLSRGAGVPATQESDESAKLDWLQLRTISPLSALPMAFAVTCSGIAALSLGIQLPPLLEARGFSPAFAATALGLSAAGGMLGNLGAGWWLDHWKSGWTSASVGVTVAAGLSALASLAVFPSAPLAVAGSLLFGIGLGASEVMWITLTKRQFGTALFAFTYGAWSFSYSLGYALAGSTGGAAFDAFSIKGYLAFIGALCLPTVVFSIWRRGARNEQPREV